MGIKKLINKAGAKAADKINKLSTLSPEQLKHVEEQREMYLSQVPDPNDLEAEELTLRLLATCGVEIYNAYLPQLKNIYKPIVRNAEYSGEDFDIAHNIRFFNITKWVTDKKENSLEKLVNVYQVLSNEVCNIALIFNRTCNGTNVYLAVANTENADNNVSIENYKRRLSDAVKGNFPGAELTDGIAGEGVPCFDGNIDYSVATTTNIPTEKSDKFISQTIEKLLDGVVPTEKEDEYTLILLATPILDLEDRKLHLADLYTALAPYASWQTSFTYHESDSTNSMAIFGVNAGVGAGVQNSVNQAVTNTQGRTDSESNSDDEGSTKAESDATGTSKSSGEQAGIDYIGSFSKSRSIEESATRTVSRTVSKHFSKMTGKAFSTAKAVTEGITRGTNFGVNFGANFARASSVTATIGKDEGITQTFTNYNIKHALELLEQQMNRIEQGTALGMWDFGAYVISENHNVANNVAHSYTALTQGEESFLSHSAINLWRADNPDESDSSKEICDYLKELRHPLFGLDPNVVSADATFFVYPEIVNATTALSGKELAYSLNFPRKSVTGLPVLECAEFGRNITAYEVGENDPEEVHVGKVFHMNHMEATDVELNMQSLASHTFITGSTGSGKSNTVYQVINEAASRGVKFLVIEPAKGEYKHVFGSDEDVSVFGTNPSVTPLLQIDPFSFPHCIHVLEHVDRLVEIFNVCWPMYAAMPAVLKAAVERSYEDCGWDLVNSSNNYSDCFYPSFVDVARNVKAIIDASEYDTENKGAYKGSLLTRLESLTNGINGMIFTNNEIPDEELFDQNVIIDLSRVGSSETKSLLMGMLILKIQEYRMSSGIIMNSPLRHITVLEEAHNILKRTSTEQVTEGSNLLGKSVEMISNAIAEMRTYGEGFIIADQAPGLLDMAAIRNTNTKIIMRLPDKMDRELVGYAANLDDDQIQELAKLPCGVGAIYQNEWVQPVLCKVDHFDTKNKVYEYVSAIPKDPIDTLEDRLFIASILSKGAYIGPELMKDEVRPRMTRIGMDASVQVRTIRMMQNPPVEPRMTKLAPIFNELFPDITAAVKSAYQDSHDPVEWTHSAEEIIEGMHAVNIENQTKRDMIQCAMTYYLMNVVNKVDDLQKWSELGGLR